MKLLIICLLIGILTSCGTDTEKTVDLMPVVDSLYMHFNKHDWKSMAGMYADSALFLDPSLGLNEVVQSKDSIVKKYSELEAIFPNIKDSVIRTYQSGSDVITAEFISIGTGLDSTKLFLPITTIFTIKNGKIVKDHTYYDN